LPDTAVATATSAASVARLAETAVAKATSVASASALAMVVPPNVEYAAAVAMDTSATTAYGLANLAVGASATVGMMLANEKAKMPSGRVDDTGSDTSAIGAEGNLILPCRLAAATAVALVAFTAATVMEGTDGGTVATSLRLSFLLGL
jgi:hypothetical protein